MPRYSVTVTIRLDADDEDHAWEVAAETIALGADKNAAVIDSTIDDVENEDEMHDDEEG